MKYILALLSCLTLAVPVQAKIVSQPIEYTNEGTALEGYLAYDDAVTEKRPGVLVVHEWWGLNDYVKMRIHKLAELGYVAFALDMYGKGIFTSDPQKAKDLSGHLMGTPLLRERARAGLQILRQNERVDPTRIAAIGYCFGGTTVLELAYSGTEIAGVVTFHAGLTLPKPGDTIKTKLLVLHGADDGFASTQTIIDFQDALRKSGADWQMIFYGGAVHSFTNPGADQYGIKGIAYNKKADERSWKHMQLFLREIFS